jgi:hypothetical protein
LSGLSIPVDPDPTVLRGALVAIRGQDFARTLAETVLQLESDETDTPGVGGWAIFDYDHARQE